MPNIKKKSKTLFTVFIFGAYAVYSYILLPIYVYLCNDIIYLDTVLPNIVQVIYTLVELSVIVFSFAFIVYYGIKHSLKGAKYFIFSYSGAILFKYLSNYLITSVMEGSISFTSLGYVGVLILVEAFQLGILVFCVRSIRNECSAALDAGRSCFPLKKLFDLGNPMQRSAFIGALIICVLKVITRIIYDITYGMPDSVLEVLVMVGYYSLDIAVGVMCYFAEIWILMGLNEKEADKSIPSTDTN